MRPNAETARLGNSHEYREISEPCLKDQQTGYRKRQLPQTAVTAGGSYHRRQ